MCSIHINRNRENNSWSHIPSLVKALRDPTSFLFVKAELIGSPNLFANTTAVMCSPRKGVKMYGLKQNWPRWSVKAEVRAGTQGLGLKAQAGAQRLGLKAHCQMNRGQPVLSALSFPRGEQGPRLQEDSTERRCALCVSRKHLPGVSLSLGWHGHSLPSDFRAGPFFVSSVVDLN